MTAKVGLIVGREWSFPPKFIDEVNRRDKGVVADFIKIDQRRWTRRAAMPSSLISDLARGSVLPVISEARGAAGGRGREQPFHVERR